MVKVTKEPEEFGPPLEPCSICYERTKFWYVPKDVALCQRCAKTAKPDDIPSKERWCANVEQLICFDSGGADDIVSAHPTAVRH